MKGKTVAEQSARVFLLSGGTRKFRVDRQMLGQDGNFHQVFMDVVAISGADAGDLANQAKAEQDETMSARHKCRRFNPSMP
jgi:hypothetical protein